MKRLSILKLKKYKSGFTYIGVLFLVFLMGLNLSLAGVLYKFTQQREKEKQLIFIGEQFKQAIEHYYWHSPGTVKQYPPNLESLLMDNRYVNTQRYLRKIYIDPMTKTTNWGVVQSPQGGVMGVYSQSEEASLKFANFGLGNLELENKKYYKDWQFTYIPEPSQINIPKIN
jgi:type II secretory pathway pseudopilin PulG